MFRYAFLFTVLFTNIILSFSQATLYVDDFESGLPAWTATDDVTPNFWILEGCAGNGPSIPGSNSMYISIGGVTPGCGATGNIQYSYSNSPAGVQMATNYTSIDASCASGIQATFDYKIDGVSTQDFGELVYSLDGGTSWLSASGELGQSATWTNTTVNLPATVDGIAFELGFRFTYNDATITGAPLAVDNLVVTGTDNIQPTITCPADTNIYVDINCDGLVEDYTGDAIVSDNCTALGNLIVTQDVAPGTVISGVIVVTNVTLTVEDETGNTASCIFETRTIDTLVATITCPIDTNVYADASCEGFLEDYTADAIAMDNCTPIGSLTVTQSPAPGTMITSNQIITLTVSGAVPNVDQSCTFNGVFVDTISPTIVCPSSTPLYVDNSCQALLTDYSSGGVIVENCTPIASITQLPLPGTSVTVTDNITVTLTATDAFGNTGQCQFNQPILDTISPTITCPSNQTENADINCQSSLGDYTGMTVGTDNCSATLILTQSPPPASTITGTTSITMTLEDEYGNNSTCLFDVDILDVSAPVAVCPSDLTVSTNVGCDYDLQDFMVGVSANDNCTPAISLTYTQSPVIGTILPVGTHIITIDAMDAASNVGSCTFNLTVEDQTNPIVTTCPPNQTIYADASCTGIISDYTGMAVASDNCSPIGNILISQSPISGTSISTTTPITITVEDENSNTNTCVFNAIFIDTISPGVNCPSDQTIAIDASCSYLMPDLSGMVSGTDNCSLLGNMNIAQNPLAGTTQSGQTAVLITLTDEGSNSSTCIVNMIPDDINAPTINCPTPAAVDLGITCDFALPNYGTTASVLDNCSGYSISQTPPAGTIVNPGMTSITLLVTDIGGNTDQCSFVLSVTESQTPTITCPSNISTCDPSVTYVEPTFSDNCFSYLTQTDLTGLSSGMTFPIGTTTLEYTVLDSSGNINTCTFNVEILDFPSSANIAEDTIFLCDQNSAVLNADAVTSGTPEWILVSGQATFNNQFANTTGINNLGYGENVFAWTNTSASCGSLSDTIIVMNTQLDLTASTQDTLYSCTDSTVLLQANTPLYGIGTWTATNGATIDDLNSSNTFGNVYDTQGWTDFIWTISNGGCPATSDTLRVFHVINPIIDQADTLVCLENDLIELSATSIVPVDQNIQWAVISGDAIIDSPNNIITDAHSFGLGSTLITCSYIHETCQTMRDTIVISGNLCDGFDPIIPTLITPGNLDGKNDVFTIDFLSTVYPDCSVIIFNRWGSVVFESTGYDTPWDGTSKNGDLLPMGTYFYHIALNDGSGQEYKGDISIIH